MPDKQKETQPIKITDSALKMIMDASPVGMIVFDSDARIIYVNPLASAIFGKSETEVFGTRCLDFISCASRHKKTQGCGYTTSCSKCQLFSAVYSTLTDRSNEAVLEGEVFLERDADLTNIQVKYKVSSVMMEGAKIAIMAVDDTTERRPVDELIRQKYSFQSLIIDKMGEGFCVCNAIEEYPFVEFTIWNKRMTKITGYTLDEINRLGWYQTLYPEHELQAEAMKRMEKMRQGEDLIGEEWEITRADGSNRVLSISTSIMESEGVMHVLALMQDITEQKRAEEALLNSEKRFRILVSASSEVLYRMSPDWTEMRQLNSRGFLAETKRPNPNWLQEYIPPDDQAYVTATINEAILSKKIFELEHRVLRKDGSFGWTFSRAVPLMDANGEIVEWFGEAIDISRRKQAEEALIQLNETLEQQVAERTALANARAKELQTLAVELIEVEEKERRRFAELLHEDLQQILAGTKMQLQAYYKGAIKDVLNDVEKLLDESIRKSRHLAHELSPPVLQIGLVPAIKWLARQIEEQFGLKIQLEIKAKHHFEDESLRTCMFRSVKELLFNIVKHAGVKNARLILSGSENALIITIIDNGCGFNTDILNNLQHKVGFGLLTIKERANYIGGSLTIDSTPGKGSKFTLTMPLRTSKDKGLFPNLSSTSQASEVPAELASSKIRILFADDHAVMRQGLIKLIRGQPQIAVAGEAANGRKALELARQLRPDLIVMDISMPEMDGIEATRLIKAEMPEIRVIGLSMYEDEQIAQRMSEAGAEAFVSKSAGIPTLLKAIYGNKSEN